MDQPQLLPQDTAALDRLEEIVERGFAMTSRTDLSKNAQLPRTLTAMLYAIVIHNFGASVALQLRHGLTHGALVSLRTMLESYIKLKHMLLNASLEHSAGEVIRGMQEQHRGAHNFNEYLKRHPEDRREGYGLDDAFVKRHEDELAAVKARFPAARPGRQLLEMAREVDTSALPREAGEERLEYLYFLLYWMGSNTAHANMLGLDAFIQIKPGPLHAIQSHGDLNDVGPHAAMASRFCEWCQALYPRHFPLSPT